MKADSNDGRAAIAVLCGYDEVRQAAFNRHSGPMVPLLGNNDSRLLLNECGLPWLRFHVAPNYFRGEARWRFDRHHLIWNTISDADINPRCLRVAARVAAASGLRVVNPPALVARTTRDQNARCLQGIPGAIVPRTVRLRRPTMDRVRRQLQAGGLRFPLIVRRVGSHTGRIVGLFRAVEDFESVRDGLAEELYLTEYHDYRAPDGLFSKWRVFCIGESLVLRHVLAAADWIVNADTGNAFLRQNAALRDRERHHLHCGIGGLPTGVQAAIRQIQRRIGLDYFGIDFTVTPSGQLLLFEANATMNFFPFLDDPELGYRKGAKSIAVEAIRRLIEQRARPTVGEMARLPTASGRMRRT